MRWVYYRNKEELVAITRELGLECDGRVDDLQKRLSAFIQSGKYSPGMKMRLGDIEARFPK